MDESLPNKIRVEYVKSHLFRTIHADGAFGGATPRLELLITFYSERFPIPKVLTYETSPDGLGDEIVTERESKEGIIREVEAAVVLDLPTAQFFAQWLNGKVAELEKQREQVASSQRKAEEVRK
jgi:hypothetical protein